MLDGSKMAKPSVNISMVHYRGLERKEKAEKQFGAAMESIWALTCKSSLLS